MTLTGTISTKKYLCPRLWAMLFVIIACSAAAPRASAISFALDSIATWGKFPRFCVNTYRWGDKFFNSYDSTYVQGSGKRWNIKMKGDSWRELFNFRFVTDDYRMQMVSAPTITAGFYLSYMAVSVGYDMNVGKYFGGGESARRRFNFEFNCSLFAVGLQYVNNNNAMHIERMGLPGNVQHTKIKFTGADTQSWLVSLYYFFNHRHYSQGAAFSYSKIQMRSSGTMFAGLQFSGMRYNFNFSSLQSDIRPRLPERWNDIYNVRNNNYGLKVGYAYNWVFHHGWVAGISAAPSLGLRQGYINLPGENSTSFFFSGHLRASIVYNLKKRWFFGAVFSGYADFVYDKEHTLMANSYNVELSAGFRFDLWK